MSADSHGHTTPARRNGGAPIQIQALTGTRAEQTEAPEYTLEEVGCIVGLTAGYLRRLERGGVIPEARRIGSGKIRVYSPPEIDELRRRLCR